MKAKEFLEKNEISSVETVGDLIINLVVGDRIFGLMVDTSNLQVGNLVIRTEDFIVEDDIIRVGDIILDLSTTDMLSDSI
jgi:hypothetical protein